MPNIQTLIHEGISKIEAENKSRTANYKARLKEQIRVNLQEKKQTVESNKGLVDRYYGATQQPLTQMQQALLEAAV